jgi:pimeloyl-ACP methyl ester carboxylesterase
MARSGLLVLLAMLLRVEGIVALLLVATILAARFFLRLSAYPGSVLPIAQSMEKESANEIMQEFYQAAVHMETALKALIAADSRAKVQQALALAGLNARSLRSPPSAPRGTCPPSAALLTLSHFRAVLAAQLAMSDHVRLSSPGERSSWSHSAPPTSGETVSPYARRLLHELSAVVATVEAVVSTAASAVEDDDWMARLPLPLPEAAQARAISAVSPGSAVRPTPATPTKAVAGLVTSAHRTRYVTLHARQGAIEARTLSAIRSVTSSGTLFAALESTVGRLQLLQRLAPWLVEVPVRRLVRRGRWAGCRRCSDRCCGAKGCGPTCSACCVDCLGCPGPSPCSGFIECFSCLRVPPPSSLPSAPLSSGTISSRATPSDALTAAPSSSPLFPSFIVFPVGSGNDNLVVAHHTSHDDDLAEEAAVLAAEEDMCRSVEEASARVRTVSPFPDSAGLDLSAERLPLERSPAGLHMAPVVTSSTGVEGEDKLGDHWRDVSNARWEESMRTTLERSEPVRLARAAFGTPSEETRPAERPREGDEEGIMSLIMAVPRAISNAFRTVVDMSERRGAPGPVAGLSFLRVEALLAHNGWTVALSQPDGAVIDAMFLPFRTDSAPPNLALFVKAGQGDPATAVAIRDGRLVSTTTPVPPSPPRMVSNPLVDGPSPSRRRPFLAASTDGASSPPAVEFHRRDIHERPVILCCNPNGGLYEQWHRWAESLDIFLQHGYSVMLFNYRGYGRSTGSPNPSRCIQDVSQLVRYVRGQLGVSHVLAHSESIGGICSCALAEAGLVDGLIADRAFDHVGRAAKNLMGAWAGWGVALLSRWAAHSNAQAVLRAKCPKILLADPFGDEVIHLDASLTGNVAWSVAQSWCRAVPPLKLAPASIDPIVPLFGASDSHSFTQFQSLVRRAVLSLGKAVMAHAHQLTSLENLRQSIVSSDVRFPQASLRLNTARPDSAASVLAVQSQATLDRVHSLESEISAMGRRNSGEDSSYASIDGTTIASAESPLRQRVTATRSSSASLLSMASSPSSQELPSSTAFVTVDDATASKLGCFPLYLPTSIPPTYLDTDLIASCRTGLSSRFCSPPSPPSAEDVLTSLIMVQSAGSVEHILRDATLRTRLQQTAIPTVREHANLILAACSNDLSLAILVTLANAELVGGMLLDLCRPSFLQDGDASIKAFALELVYSSSWSTPSGAMLSTCKNSFTAGVLGLEWSNPQRAAFNLPLSPNPHAASLPMVPWAADVEASDGNLPVGPLGPSLAFSAEILDWSSDSPSKANYGAPKFTLHRACALASRFERELVEIPPEVQPVGAAESLRALESARQLLQLMEWIAWKGGPSQSALESARRVDLPPHLHPTLPVALSAAATAPGPADPTALSTAVKSHAWASFASRSLRPEGLLLALKGRGHNGPWRRHTINMVSEVGAHLAWWTSPPALRIPQSSPFLLQAASSSEREPNSSEDTE